jgi:hypothetical protein
LAIFKTIKINGGGFYGVCPKGSKIISIATPAPFKTAENECLAKLVVGTSLKFESFCNSFHLLIYRPYCLVYIFMNWQTR